MVRAYPVSPWTVLGVILVVFLLISVSWCASTVRLTIEMFEHPGSNGVIKVSVWKGESAFLKGKPYREASANMADGKATAVFDDMEPGDYAVSAYYDKNKNGKMDQNFVGKPTEPYGFSNDARGKFGPAKYQDSRLDLAAEDRIVTIHLK